MVSTGLEDLDLPKARKIRPKSGRKMAGNKFTDI